MPANSDLVASLISHCDAPLFSLSGRGVYALVVDAYDLDTFQAVIETSGEFHRFIIRVAGIDGPEMKDKNAIIKDWAVRGRNRMLSIIAPNAGIDVNGTYSRKDIRLKLREAKPIVFLNLGESDKYGRILADVRADEADTKTFQEILVDEGYCKPYGVNGNLTKDVWLEGHCGGALRRTNAN